MNGWLISNLQKILICSTLPPKKKIKVFSAFAPDNNRQCVNIVIGITDMITFEYIL